MSIILKSLVVVFQIQLVTSTKDVILNDLSQNTVVSLLNILSKYKNDLKYVIIQPNKWITDKSHGNDVGKSYNPQFYEEIINDHRVNNKKFHRPGRHMLIKRLLPHGLPPSKLEYDSKFKTFYRPLVRIHKRKSLPKIENILNINKNTNGMDNYGIDFYDYYDNDEHILKFALNKESNKNFKYLTSKEADKYFDVDEELLQPFTTKFIKSYEARDEEILQLIILEDIQRLLRKIRSRSSRTKIYNDITRVLDKIDTLRSHQKSGEDNDPMAPGKIINIENDEVQEGPQKPKKWIPHYAPWNFWTYNKSIYQDVCPEGQVKIANLCIWVPPH